MEKTNLMRLLEKKFINLNELEEIEEDKNVITVDDCGMSGNYIGKHWYAVVLNNEEEYNVYTELDNVIKIDGTLFAVEKCTMHEGEELELLIRGYQFNHYGEPLNKKFLIIKFIKDTVIDFFNLVSWIEDRIENKQYISFCIKEQTYIRKDIEDMISWTLLYRR
jgi:hypothetical protein